MLNMLLAFWRDEDGNELVTWLVVAALVVAIAASVFATGGPLEDALDQAVRSISNAITNATGTGP